MKEILENLYAPALSVGILSLSAFILKHLVNNWAARSKRSPFPPGPKPRFLVGNMYDIPTDNAAYHYMEWGKRYDCESDLSFPVCVANQSNL